MNTEDFQREERYTIFKNKDMFKYLTDAEVGLIHQLITKINLCRHSEGKYPLETVIIESDWQCSEKVWELVQQEWEARQKPTL